MQQAIKGAAFVSIVCAENDGSAPHISLTFDLWNNSNVQNFKPRLKGTSGLDMMFNAGVTHAARLEYNFLGGYCLFDKDHLF